MFARATRGTLIATCVVLFACGVSLASLGPLLPDLHRQTGSSLATLGSVFAAWFVGSLIAQVSIGVINERIGRRWMIFGELIVMAIGLLGLWHSTSLAIDLFCAGLGGMGQGAVDITVTVVAAEVFADRSVAVLNFINVWFGLGAILGPSMVAISLRFWGTGMPVIGIVVGLVIILIPWVVTSPTLRPTHIPNERSATRRSSGGTALYRAPILWVLGVFFLIYVGTESAIGGWTAEYLHRVAAVPLAFAAVATSAFWLALTLARVAMVWLARRAGPLTLLWIALIGYVGGGALLVAAHSNVPAAIAAIVLLGLSCGPLFPTALAYTTALFAARGNGRSAATRAASVVVSMGSIGGMIIPWAEGIILFHVNPAASAIFLTLMGGGMLGLAIGLSRNEAVQGSPAAA